MSILLLLLLLGIVVSKVLLLLLLSVLSSNIVTVVILSDKLNIFSSPLWIIFHCLSMIIFHSNHLLIQSLQKFIWINDKVSTDTGIERSGVKVSIFSRILVDNVLNQFDSSLFKIAHKIVRNLQIIINENLMVPINPNF